uniref:ETS domain-containing protein n=1 Tax=Schistocephalus solidus TaxID=70667 RepID=A0A0V0J7L9_SCHSO
MMMKVHTSNLGLLNDPSFEKFGSSYSSATADCLDPLCSSSYLSGTPGFLQTTDEPHSPRSVKSTSSAASFQNSSYSSASPTSSPSRLEDTGSSSRIGFPDYDDEYIVPQLTGDQKAQVEGSTVLLDPTIAVEALLSLETPESESNHQSSSQDRELEEAVAYLWPAMDDRTPMATKQLEINASLGDSQGAFVPSFTTSLISDLHNTFPYGDSSKGLSDIELEHQLASADTAWTATVEFPALAAEDVDQVLNATSEKGPREQAPIKNRSQITTSPVHTHRRSCEPTRPAPHRRINHSNLPSAHSSSTTHYNKPLKATRANTSLKPRLFCPSTQLAVDSESTETGSEAEQCRQICRNEERLVRYKARRKRFILLGGRKEWVEELDEQSSASEEELSYSHPAYEGTKRRRAMLHSEDYQASGEPWWPHKQSPRSNTDNPGLRPLEVQRLQMQPSEEDTTQGSRSCPESSAGPATATTTNVQLNCRRNRKQFELWEFILRSLNSRKTSAFQWVNQSAGIFRITDTRQAAREWGRYRNNSRMNYEKMARAMRFYYKNSMLRKAQKQLHFQFAMSFVEWSTRQQTTVGLGTRKLCETMSDPPVPNP